MIDNKIAFIGGGNMASAIAGGLLRGGMHATNIFISEPKEEQCEKLREEFYGTYVSTDNKTVSNAAEVILFAVKPQILKSVCNELRETIQKTKPLIISIAAGPSIQDIDQWLGGDMTIVRVMPNQPAMIDQGVSAMFANSLTQPENCLLAEKIMSSVGKALWLEKESQMDAVTAISGTGPAYFYLLIDVMIEAAIKNGMNPEIARILAVETARGASALSASSPETMTSMIERVRSPGGTTMAAFEYLDSKDARKIFSKAIDVARERAKELAEEAKQ
ncbi:MAG: pyrroline-5-carboxylate reductase [Woeseiaceae bacterium]|jgi:pyrroline-5-carboxylate reductase|tara:strand:- start:3897 stop:4724 length:828 start_codon:yes stop_codon:yes gene_type:complete